MVISKTNAIIAILSIFVLPFATSDFKNDIRNPCYCITYALFIFFCSRLLWNLFVWIRLKVELFKLKLELVKTRQENNTLREEQLQLQDQLIQALNEYNDNLIRRLNEHQRFRDSLHEFMNLYAENSNSLDGEYLDDEDLDQADQIEIMYESCSLLY